MGDVEFDTLWLWVKLDLFWDIYLDRVVVISSSVTLWSCFCKYGRKLM